MSNHTGQSLTQTQQLGLRLSQAQVRFVRLLEMSSQELDDAVYKEMEENPALTIADANEDEEKAQGAGKDSYSPLPLPARRRDPDKNYDYLTPADTDVSLYNVLERQIETLPVEGKAREAALYIAGTLDGNGFLSRPLEAVASDMFFAEGVKADEKTMEEALELVQSLDPPGVGARNLRESLLLQVDRLLPMQTKGSEQEENLLLARRVLETYFDELALRHTHKLQSALKIPAARLEKVMETIRRLNPKPGAAYGDWSRQSNYIIPDFIVTTDNGEIHIALNNSLPELAVEKSFSDAMRQLEHNRKNHKGFEFITSRYNDAREFMKVLSRRQQTLYDVMTAIIKIQRDYFLTEDESRLKPMGLKDVADVTGFDMSVISRSTRNKYVSVPWGILPLRFFFSEAFGTQDSEDSASGREIENAIKKLVDGEDKKHPLSDDALCRLLREQGYNVSRRTVNKYRDRLGIEVSRLRRKY